MSETEALVLYELDDAGVARITMNRPGASNAQNVAMTYALDEAFMRAAKDNAVRCIILRGAGRNFSAGHDLRDRNHDAVGRDYPLTGVWGDVETQTVEGWMGWEHETYLDACRRWRSIPKPTIAQVQGGCIAGGLMLAWVCDIIVAAEDSVFQDPVVNIGVLGVEYFAHVWELGPRKAKELLFTTESWSAQEAHRMGMVNHVVPGEELSDFVEAMAKKIATKPTLAIKLAKEVINSSVDMQGLQRSMDLAFAYHQLNHADNRLRFGGLLNPHGIPEVVRRKGNLSELVVGDGRDTEN
ncbi:enoyl-CoA hydratase [Novosphingobium marinum]|uniref:Enoyl-CoA hydratase n=1 Tax=Novosphingobium marinum TaxID=1514948 RepID=A0A7Y9XVX9_9SPHN|nr:enoyl-CoA hydratase [Novosphingobium marinum]NYH95507.1 enoyl-CoA hydratase [Novosphingobium marinum]GGC27597.1 enoyl-CoA hydratase [Novosphingobium marinum]